jgi:hypothetical protein
MPRANRNTARKVFSVFETYGSKGAFPHTRIRSIEWIGEVLRKCVSGLITICSWIRWEWLWEIMRSPKPAQRSPG